MDSTAFINSHHRRQGSPYWNVIADRQRNPFGWVVCPLDDRVWPPYLESELEFDCIVPKKRGGKYTLANCQLVCPSCNRSKNDGDNDQARARLLAEQGMSQYEKAVISRRKSRKKRAANETAEHRDVRLAKKRAQYARMKNDPVWKANRTGRRRKLWSNPDYYTEKLRRGREYRRSRRAGKTGGDTRLPGFD